jgi:hypothetical protein
MLLRPNQVKDIQLFEDACTIYMGWWHLTSEYLALRILFCGWDQVTA